MALNPKQQAFVREYLVDHNATQAAIRAGYSPKTARSVGSENLTKPDIKAAIDEATAKLTAKAEITVEEVLRGLKQEAATAEQDSARVQAWGLLGKYLKMFTDKTELSGADGKPARVIFNITRTVKG